MAPEQSVGRSVFSTDLYALGLTNIYALTKKLPVEFETSQLTGELDWQSHVPDINKDLAEILDKAIQMEPSRRYTTAEAMYQDLHSLISSGTMPVFPIQTVKVNPDNNVINFPSSSVNPQNTFVSTSNALTTKNNEGKSKIVTLLTILIGIFVVAAGLGGGFIITQQVKEAEKKVAQAEKEKQEAEKKRIEAEQKMLEEKNRQRELEQQQIEAERQRLEGEVARAKQERQRLIAERKKMQNIASQPQDIGQEVSTIGGISGSKNIRSGPGTEYGVVGQGYTGDSLEILDSTTNSDGYVWYKVYHPSSGVTGWIASHLVN